MLVHSESFSNPPTFYMPACVPWFCEFIPRKTPPHPTQRFRFITAVIVSLLICTSVWRIMQKKKVTSLFYRRDLSRKKYHIWNGDKILRILIPHMKEIEGLRSKKSIIEGLKSRYNARSFQKIWGVKIDDLKMTVNLFKHRDRGFDQNFRFF